MALEEFLLSVTERGRRDRTDGLGDHQLLPSLHIVRALTYFEVSVLYFYCNSHRRISAAVDQQSP